MAHFLAEPADDFPGHAGLRPRFDFAGMDDAAIAPARLHAGFRLAFDHFGIVASFLGIPSRGCAGGAGAKNHDGHG
jgi:hypothetical protein